MKVKVEVVEYISYSTQEIEGYEVTLTWESNKACLSLYSYRDSLVLEYLEHLGISGEDVVLDYIDKGFDYVA